MASSGILPGSFRGTFHLHDYSVYQALGLLELRGDLITKATPAGPAEPLVYKGNPAAFNAWELR
jgi:hypothetical protein